MEIHPHARKHGLTDDAIDHAWQNAFAWMRRICDNGGVDYLVVGTDQNGRLIELIARTCKGGDFIVFHAMTPPTKKLLREMGLDTR